MSNFHTLPQGTRRRKYAPLVSPNGAVKSIVVPESVSALIRDLKKRRPKFVKIPDNDLGVSGMTVSAFRSTVV